MIPGNLNADPSKSLYYSLEVPTLMAFSPRSKKIANKLDDLREIKHIVQRVKEYLRENKLKLNQDDTHEIVDGLNFEYYQTDEDSYNETVKSYKLQEIDQNIVQENKKFKKEFCDTSPFLRGCVRISMIKNS